MTKGERSYTRPNSLRSPPQTDTHAESVFLSPGTRPNEITIRPVVSPPSTRHATPSISKLKTWNSRFSLSLSLSLLPRVQLNSVSYNLVGHVIINSCIQISPNATVRFLLSRSKPLKQPTVEVTTTTPLFLISER